MESECNEAVTEVIVGGSEEAAGAATTPVGEATAGLETKHFQESARLPPPSRDELRKVVILEILNAFVIFTTALTRAFNFSFLLSVLF
jgi:hypothetical protein